MALIQTDNFRKLLDEGGSFKEWRRLFVDEDTGEEHWIRDEALTRTGVTVLPQN